MAPRGENTGVLDEIDLQINRYREWILHIDVDAD